MASQSVTTRRRPRDARRRRAAIPSQAERPCPSSSAAWRTAAARSESSEMVRRSMGTRPTVPDSLYTSTRLSGQFPYISIFLVSCLLRPAAWPPLPTRTAMQHRVRSPPSGPLPVPQLAKEPPPNLPRDEAVSERPRDVAVVPEPYGHPIRGCSSHVLRGQLVQLNSHSRSLLARPPREWPQRLLRDDLKDPSVRFERRGANLRGQVHQWAADLPPLRATAFGQPSSRGTQPPMGGGWNEQPHGLEFIREIPRRCNDRGVLVADDHPRRRYSLLNSGYCRPTSSSASCNSSLPPIAASCAFCSSLRRGSPCPGTNGVAADATCSMYSTVAVAGAGVNSSPASSKSCGNA